MSFESSAVTLVWNQNNLILRRGTSTLVISAQNVQELRLQDSEELFNSYFRTKALENREARRVFESWEKKDVPLLSKIYREMLA